MTFENSAVLSSDSAPIREDSIIIINVPGVGSGKFQNYNLEFLVNEFLVKNFKMASKVLWNFPGATSLDISGLSSYGTLLAPNANVGKSHFCVWEVKYFNLNCPPRYQFSQLAPLVARSLLNPSVVVVKSTSKSSRDVSQVS